MTNNIIVKGEAVMTIEDIEKYKNKLPYPERVVQPRLSIKPIASDAKRFAELMIIYEDGMKAYKQKLEAYRREDNRLNIEFRRDALTEVGLWGHPKADKAYNMAWQRGHSDGFYQVFCELEELAELILD